MLEAVEFSGRTFNEILTVNITFYINGKKKSTFYRILFIDSQSEVHKSSLVRKKVCTWTTIVKV